MAPDSTKPRLLYIDNLRIFLIALVVLHHLAITYGAPGGWYYRENEADAFSMIPLTLFVATNQSFFMGFFFLISAYFTPGAYDRKGGASFLKDRLLRLGIPLLVFYFLLSPLTVYWRTVLAEGAQWSFGAFLRQERGFGFGPLWFVETLLYFTLVYWLLRRGGISAAPKPRALPGDRTIFLFALLLGALTFLVRIRLPVGWAVPHLGLQLPHFVQYIAMLILGVVAYRNHWFQAISYEQGRRWFRIAQGNILVLFPLLFVLGGAMQGKVEPFVGGWHWQSLAYAVWEQLTGLALMVGLTGIFKEKWNTQGTLERNLSAAAYTVFIIHAPLLVGLTLLVREVDLYPLLKFVLVAPVSLGLAFLVSNYLRRIPYARRIL